MLLNGLTSSTALDSDSKAGASQAQLNEDLNRFLNLLVTQLKHQDPLEPMDANEFTSQLVQFANVEQQIYQNANLEKLVSLQQTSQVSFMVDYLGKMVEAPGKAFTLENGLAEATYTLDERAAETVISIKDASGGKVLTTSGETDIGKHAFVWNGLDDFDNPMADGTYTLTVTALDAQGKLLDVTQTVFGKVTGAGAEDGQVSLFIGDTEIPMEDVITVREPASGGGTGS